MILRGWKNICAAVGGMSTSTARRLMREQGMPVSLIAGAPMTTTEALEEWVACRCQRINMAELSAHLIQAALPGSDGHNQP